MNDLRGARRRTGGAVRGEEVGDTVSSGVAPPGRGSAGIPGVGEGQGTKIAGKSTSGCARVVLGLLGSGTPWSGGG